MVNMAEMTAAALKTTLPGDWASQEIVNLKHWYKHGPSDDSSRWFNQQLGKLVTVVTNINAQAKIKPKLFDKMADYTIQMCMFTTRTLARLARIIFEVRAATKARQYYMNDPQPGVSSADPGLRGQGPSGHLDQDMEDLPPPPRRDPGQRERDWTMQQSGQAQGGARPTARTWRPRTRPTSTTREVTSRASASQDGPGSEYTAQRTAARRGPQTSNTSP